MSTVFGNTYIQTTNSSGGVAPNETVQDYLNIEPDAEEHFVNKEDLGAILEDLGIQKDQIAQSVDAIFEELTVENDQIDLKDLIELLDLDGDSIIEITEAENITSLLRDGKDIEHSQTEAKDLQDTYFTNDGLLEEDAMEAFFDTAISPTGALIAPDMEEFKKDMSFILRSAGVDTQDITEILTIIETGTDADRLNIRQGIMDAIENSGSHTQAEAKIETTVDEVKELRSRLDTTSSPVQISVEDAKGQDNALAEAYDNPDLSEEDKKKLLTEVLSVFKTNVNEDMMSDAEINYLVDHLYADESGEVRSFDDILELLDGSGDADDGIITVQNVRTLQYNIAEDGFDENAAAEGYADNTDLQRQNIRNFLGNIAPGNYESAMTHILEDRGVTDVSPELAHNLAELARKGDAPYHNTGADQDQTSMERVLEILTMSPDDLNSLSQAFANGGTDDAGNEVPIANSQFQDEATGSYDEPTIDPDSSLSEAEQTEISNEAQDLMRKKTGTNPTTSGFDKDDLTEYFGEDFFDQSADEREYRLTEFFSRMGMPADDMIIEAMAEDNSDLNLDALFASVAGDRITVADLDGWKSKIHFEKATSENSPGGEYISADEFKNGLAMAGTHRGVPWGDMEKGNFFIDNVIDNLLEDQTKDDGTDYTDEEKLKLKLKLKNAITHLSADEITTLLQGNEGLLFQNVPKLCLIWSSMVVLPIFRQ